ncbi:MAG: GNAT family N-acetyltransferase [Melioribacteraceae bacterium]
MNNLTIREANIEDAKLLYELSNQEDVRANSINQKQIDWNDHLAWLNKKLNDSNYKIFIYFDRNNYVGQVKFELEKKQATISISITREMRGRGYSQYMLSKAIKELLAANNSIANIIALIKPVNTASINAFKKVGFAYSGEVKIKNSIFHKYLLRNE